MGPGGAKSGANPQNSGISLVDSPNSEKIVTIIGGSGFVGRHLVRALAKRGYRIRVACRRPDLAGHVQPLGTPGQIMPVQANVRYPASIAAACDGATAVINLTGVLASSGAQSFDAIHVFGAEATARAAKAAGAARLHPDVGAWRRCRFHQRLCPQQGYRRSQGQGGVSRGHYPAALDCFRAGRQFLQQVRSLEPPGAGLAAARRREHKIRAAFCGRPGRGHGNAG